MRKLVHKEDYVHYLGDEGLHLVTKNDIVCGFYFGFKIG